MSIDTVNIWLAALATLAIFSILYRENAVYRLFEHIFIGLATGFGLYTTWNEVLRPNWWNPMTMADKGAEPQWYWIFALVVGLMFYTIYTPRYAWMSRLLMTALMGMAAGIFFQGFARLYIPQLTQSFLPILKPDAPYVLFGNLVIVVTIITVMTYFFFSFEHRHRVVQGSASLGRWLLMVAFGAIFGSTVMARMALLTYRMWFLIHDWLHLGSR